MVSNNASNDGSDLRLLRAESCNYQRSLLSRSTIYGGPRAPIVTLLLATDQGLGALPIMAATRATYSRNDLLCNTPFASCPVTCLRGVRKQQWSLYAPRRALLLSAYSTSRDLSRAYEVHFFGQNFVLMQCLFNKKFWRRDLKLDQDSPF